METRLKHEFGGEWTRQKLAILNGYLRAYCTIFNANAAARFYNTWYVDAFAGTGYIARPTGENDDRSLLGDLTEPENAEFLKGSATIALDIAPGFKNYLFIDKSSRHCDELEGLKTEYPGKHIKVVNDGANSALRNWAQSQNWSQTRAVVFLDPYGMQVDWKTVELLAETKGVDLWILLPIGVALNRLLPRGEKPSGKFAERLDDFLGPCDWREEFYARNVTTDLFGEEHETFSRTANIDALGEFVLKRLKGVFHSVHPKPKPLLSSRGNPLYLFCFAAGNERGAPTAMKIAAHLLKSGNLS